MRYFLFTIRGTYRNVNIAMEHPAFPSISDIKNQMGGEDFTISNVFEFQSKEDYESFTSKD